MSPRIDRCIACAVWSYLERSPRGGVSMRHAWIGAWFLMMGCSGTATFGGGTMGGGDGSTASDGPRRDDGGRGAPDGGGGGANDSGTSDAGPNPCVAPTALVLTPPALTSPVVVGGGFTQSYTATAKYNGMPDVVVTASTFFESSDATLGTMTGATFSWAGTHGGSTTVRGTTCGVTGTATLTLDLSGAIAGDPNVDPATAQMQFTNGMPSGNTGCAPTLLYPPDGVLIPPNTNIIEVHFLPGGTPANTLFELSFENAVTDIRVYTTCTGNTAAVGMPLNGGCVFELNQMEWDYVAQTNRDGAPVTVKVRALGCDGTNVSSSAPRDIAFAKEDLVGALFYWASMRIVVNGGNVNSGGIFSYDFGVRGQSANPVLTPSSAANPNGLCIGCHDISRDGRQMVFDFDDNDDDDEYSDVRTDVYDIVKKQPAQAIIKNGTNVFPPGYHTWNRETSEFLLSDGPGNKSTPAGAFRRVSPAGVTLGYTQSGTLRGTSPDWAPNDSEVVFAVPTGYLAPNANAAATTGPDLWFTAASLYTAPWDAMAKTLGVPTLLVAPTGGGNYYYPSYSPDGSLIAFNHAASGANFHNPNARVQLVAAAQANPTPLDLAKLNDTGMLTNSWARWSPFQQSYQSGNILWITFSSTRSYGLRIINDNSKQNCYPTESPQGYPAFNNNTNCTRAQIWMAAIQLDPNAVQAQTDVSWPAFWLPFQDLQTNNHLAQWAQQSFTGPCAKASDCAMGQCCDMGGCTACATLPPPTPSCAVDANCPTGECCSAGACGSCAPPPDGGAPGDGGAPDGGPPPTGCHNCLDCQGQACVNGLCGACASDSDCCAPLVCYMGTCVNGVP
jgi:hypothetical protein